MSTISRSPDPATSVLRYVATELRSVIQSRNVKMTDIEAAIGRSSGFVCHLAQREKTALARDAFGIAEFLGVDIDDVFVMTMESKEMFDQWRSGRIAAIDGDHARFWSKVRRVDDPDDACWEWIASKNMSGYGQIMMPGGRPMLASRFAMLITHGTIPDGYDVLHQCDNPPCVRPDHLKFGTHTDNMREMVARKRRLRGHVLVASQVIEIRSINPQTPSERREVAALFGVSAGTVKNIVERKSWDQV